MYGYMRRQNRFILSMLLIFTLVFTACGNDEKGDSSTKTATNTTKSESTSSTSKAADSTPKVDLNTTTTKKSRGGSSSTAQQKTEDTSSVTPPTKSGSQVTSYNLCNSSKEVIHMILSYIYRDYVEFSLSVSSKSYVLSSQEYLNMMPGLKSITVTLYNDYPQYGITYYTVKLSVNDYVPYAYAIKNNDFSFFTAEQTAAYNKARQIVNTYTSTSKSDYENELAIHDYLVNNAAYSTSATGAHTEYGALVTGKCVCDGYAKAFDLMMLMIGVDCYRVTGYGMADSNNDGKADQQELHAWNKVKISGQWYNVDLTWDDDETGISYNYFNLTDAMLGCDHSTQKKDYDWTSYGWPVSTTSTEYNYYYYNGITVLNNQDEFNAAVTDALNAGETTISIRYGSSSWADCAAAFKIYQLTHPTAKYEVNFNSSIAFFRQYIYTVTY